MTKPKSDSGSLSQRPRCNGEHRPWIYAPENGATESRWVRGYCVPPLEADDPHDGVVGVALSGGGVRAATVAMGVLQSARFREQVLSRATYLVAVSGGGYTAGAFVQALSPEDPPDLRLGEEVVREPTTVFEGGTPEEDYVQRHASYLADTPARVLVALGLLAWHLVLTLILLFGPAVVLGVLTGWLYHKLWPQLLDSTVANAPTSKIGPSQPHFSVWVAVALGSAVALAALVWLAREYAAAHAWLALRRALTVCAFWARVLAFGVATVTVVLPELIWLSSWALHHTRGGVHVASPILLVLLTYVTSAISVVWANRSKLSPPSWLGKILPAAVLRLGLVLLTMAVLAASWLLLIGGTATVGLAGPSLSTWITLAVLLTVLVFLGGLTDETTLSLHPYYRRRLANTFAVRRIKRDGHLVAEPYRPTERTTLSKYAQQRPDFPHVVFAASATLGKNRTPPGDRRVSYTFTGSWVGGPDVGYIRTATLQDLVPSRFKRDLTVQGAVALSGAAIAASLGGQGSSFYEALFVVSGVRLGAWMPNPAYIIRKSQETKAAKGEKPGKLTGKGLPRVRRVDYLLRELFGVHPPDGPLLQVTDGGFYDNLGLLELFRRGCTHIYCVDASGDPPPAATTLSQALARAYQELGVETVLDRNTWESATEGSGEPLSPKDPLATLSQRLSRTGIITGRFVYPVCSGFVEQQDGGPPRGKTGVLVVAKAALWRDLPYQLMAYAEGDPAFPHDTTVDQFFDGEQYAAYCTLGRQLGNQAAGRSGPSKRSWPVIPMARRRPRAETDGQSGAPQSPIP